MIDLTPRRLVRSQSPEADALTGMRKSARATRARDGLLPPPIDIGGGASAFYADELAEVIAARAAGLGDEDVRVIVARQIAARRTYLGTAV